MDAPPHKVNCQPFIETTTILRKQGLIVPKIYHKNTDQGFLLLEDFGDNMLLTELKKASTHSIYSIAVADLVKLHTCDTSQYKQLPVMKSSTLNQELDWFIARYVQQYKQETLNSAQQRIWQDTKDILTNNAANQEQVLLHKDFHSRNLMLLPSKKIGVLDFQDAVIGPITYDLASLLHDCYIDWPQHLIEKYCNEFLLLSQQAGLMTNITLQQLLIWFDLTSLQRHLKNLGNFIRISTEKKQPQFMQYLPHMCKIITGICSRHEALSDFDQYFRSLHCSHKEDSLK